KAKKMAEYSKFKFGDHRAYRDRIHNNSGMAGAKSAIKNEFSVVDNFFVDDRRWLVFLNGVLDLEEFREARIAPGDLGRVASMLYEHDPVRPVYRCVDAEFNPAAESTSWTHFLNTSLPDPELRKFLATVTGA